MTARDLGDTAHRDMRQFGVLVSILYILLGLVGLMFGGKWIVDGAVEIARNFGLSEAFIGLTVVAIGTSLPELAASGMAAWKKQTDIAVGNIVGSNIFNVLWILGISSSIRPLPFQVENQNDIVITFGTGVLLFVFVFVGGKGVLARGEGIASIILYITYIIYICLR